MSQDASETGAAGGTLVIPGEMAARVDRLPMSFMAWEICMIVQVGWAIAASTDGIASRMYPYVWLPAKEITHTQYDVLYAFQVGISILIGAYALGWLADKIGRRKALILSAVLAGVFIWPFGYVTNYPALIVLSIADTLGFAGYLAMNVVYMSEIMGPTWRRKKSSNGSSPSDRLPGRCSLTGLSSRVPRVTRNWSDVLPALSLDLRASPQGTRLPPSVQTSGACFPELPRRCGMSA